MKCPSCKGDIPPTHKGQTCPSCGDVLPKRRPIYLDLRERISDFTEDRGFIFWLITLLLVLALVAGLENLVGNGLLLRLLDRYKFISLLMILYGTLHLLFYRNINSTVRPGYQGPYWVDRLIIKRFKKGTNIAILAGILASLIVVGPQNLLALLPAYFLIISLATALFWSFESFRVDDREFQDAKVQSYFEYLGIRKLHSWRKTSGTYLISLVVCGAIFYGLSHIPGLWWKLKANPTLNELIDLGNGLFSWVPQILPNK